MFYDDGSEIPTDRFIAPRIEAELAFRLKTDLSGPDCTIFDVLNATDFVIPAIEILDARMHMLDPETRTGRKITDTISDNAANAAFVLGGRPFRPMDVDLRWVSALSLLQRQNRRDRRRGRRSWSSGARTCLAGAKARRA